MSKKEREKIVLMGLVDHFIENGEPVGSNTLKKEGFEDISSATIRNYFANLEKEGFLQQLHTSGGRIPTDKAFRAYATEFVNTEPTDRFISLKNSNSKEIARYLQQAAEILSSETKLAVFLSAPKFDHDFVSDIKLVPLDPYRFLCVIISDFGVIQTELMNTEEKLSNFAVKRVEQYFHFRLTGLDRPENLEPHEEAIGQKFYNEIMMRYIVGYSNFIDEEIYRTGFSNLLSYPDFADTTELANSLSLFENSHSMRLIIRECTAHNDLKFWVGNDLKTYASTDVNCSVITIPYHINNQVVGAVGLLGPMRMPYKKLFRLLKGFSESISDALTRNIYKFKIQYRQPQTGAPYLMKEEHQLIGQSRLMLLEDKRN